MTTWELLNDLILRARKTLDENESTVDKQHLLELIHTSSEVIRISTEALSNFDD